MLEKYTIFNDFLKGIEQDSFDIAKYQEFCPKTAIFMKNIDVLIKQDKNNGRNGLALLYLICGLNSEIGEFEALIKRKLRDAKEIDTEQVKNELGDILWYITLLAETFGLKLKDIIWNNANKLNERMKNGTIKGKGETTNERKRNNTKKQK